MQVTLCPLMCLGIATVHCPLAKLRCNYSTELAIERQLGGDAHLSLDSVNVW